MHSRRCIYPCKSGDGSYLKKIDLPTQLSRKSIKLVFTHPTGGVPGGGFGSKFQKSGKFHELSEKIEKKNLQRGLGPNFKSPVNFMNSRENR